jgi:hypothetical protein
MKKQFKSNKFRLGCAFLITSLVSFALTAAVLIGLLMIDTEMMLILFISAFIAVIIATGLIIYRWNVTLEADKDEIVFLRRNQPYLRLKFSDYDFTSYVSKDSYNFIPLPASRYIRAIPKNGGKYKDYQLYNFTRTEYEECILYINSLNYKQDLNESVIIEDNETASRKEFLEQSVESLKTSPFEYVINKELYIKRTKTTFFAILIPVVIIAAMFAFFVLIQPLVEQDENVINNLMMTVIFVIIVTGVFAIFPITLGWNPYNKALKNTPEKITVHHDRIIFDGNPYDYNNISQIRMTSPNTSGDKTFRRVIKISINGGQKIYSLGDDTDNRNNNKPKIFADYGALFDTLWHIFALRAEKNAEENGVSKFIADIS